MTISDPNTKGQESDLDAADGDAADGGAADGDAAGKSDPAANQPAHAGRDTIESIVIAVILAFLFRTFIGEMFVIPTGSMASTLQGRHVDVQCDTCGYRYRVSASDESRNFDNDGDGELDEWESESMRNARIVDVGCPNCGRPRLLDPDNKPNERSFNGDRIIVSKFAYDLADPQRWEVIVFKYPGNARVNYIKRLVGLPNEVVRIWHGNVYTSPILFRTDLSSKDALELGEVPPQLRGAFADHNLPLSSAARALPAQVSTSTSEIHGGWTRRVVDGNEDFLVAEHEGYLHIIRNRFDIVRKPSRKLLAMLQPVHNSRYVSKQLHRAGWPTRWQGMPGSGTWETPDHGRSFVSPEIDSSTDTDLHWLRYHHFRDPSLIQWEEIDAGNAVHPNEVPRTGNLVMDHYAYNFKHYLSSGPHNWVGDLAVEAELEVTSVKEDAVFCLELIRAGVAAYRCHWDLSSGEATLEILDRDLARPSQESSWFVEAPGARGETSPSAPSPLRGPGEYQVRMTNVDDEIRVWVNGSELTFDAPTTYRPTTTDAPYFRDEPLLETQPPMEPGDTAPAAIGVVAAEVIVRDMQVKRDIYYSAKDRKGGREQDFNIGHLATDDPPSRWLNPSMFGSRRELLFVLGEDQFFPLGDNSPHSSDARRWSAPSHYVDRSLLIGKAVLIYWPHPWRLLPKKLPIIRDLPLLPNFQRMGLIH